MVKKKKRGQAGSAAQYLTRNQALQKLQLKLPLFRRLCILKGIHPREPKNKPQGANKTYYHVKDVNFLLHEPLMEKFRDQQAYERKIKRARAYKNRDLLKRLIKRRPGYRLDHLVKERYPSFIDALRDLDDALSLVFLFATLPAEQQHKIPARQVELSRRLALEWQAWVVRTNSLRKVFVAVRGYYFQVRGDGADRHVDHAAPVSQLLATDVDYRVMLTFLEFYHVLLRFVNFKLYHSIGLKYPPGLRPELEEAAAGLEAVMHSLAGAEGAEEAAEGRSHPSAGRLAADATDGEEGRGAQGSGGAAEEADDDDDDDDSDGDAISGSDEDAAADRDTEMAALFPAPHGGDAGDEADET
eukprot:CAMPEP_0177627754 /NCGR_PEP_ID=MMETSP0419_2-20121207/31372_1 /TAXON_ID=582737 /ORGANISM="Tetraselmis sp., Strain GSL018" /LENGTH=356 /DNA_ID=CAMNT_0019128929 /DNA_START=19 /DNA_END=1087 /DNA_ORIENTATION=-